MLPDAELFAMPFLRHTASAHASSMATAAPCARFGVTAERASPIRTAVAVTAAPSLT